MTEEQRQNQINECLEDYHRRRAKGERPGVGEYEARLGAYFDEFRRIVDAESDLDEALKPPAHAGDLPRTFGEYTLLREVGRGAMGIVFEAMHRRLGRKVAVKVLRTGFDTDDTARQRFSREARSAAHLRHDHIVEIYDAGEINGQGYYSMALVEGRSLSELAAANALPEPKVIARAIAGVADALDALHRAGIVHRDIKPSNILVEPSGRMVLTDFGLARTAVERLTATGQALGTPLYMSPEQVLGRTAEVDGRSDVYGLGATLYEVIAGRPIFQADQPVAILRMILKERPVPPSAVRPGIDEALENLILKATEKEKTDRYATAGEMRDELIRYAEGGTVVGKPVSRGRLRARRIARMWPGIAAAAVAVAALGVYQARRPGVVHIASFPSAEVVLDGVSKGRSPFELDLAPGKHQLVLREPRFRDLQLDIEVKAGGSASFEKVLMPSNSEDTDALAALARSIDVSYAALSKPSVTRTSSQTTALPLFPRGLVRPADAATWEIEVGADYDATAKLEFRSGARVVHSEAFGPTRTGTMSGGMPESVTAALAAGEEIVWGIFPEEGAPITAVFRPIGPGHDAKIARVENVREGCPIAACHLLTQVLLNENLDVAAYREASSLVASSPDSPRGWTVMAESLHRMGLTESGLYAKAITKLQ